MFEFLENNDLGDLNRYRLLMNQLEPIPEYRTLVHALREERGNGRNDYTDETMVRVLIVKNLFQLGTDAQVRRELLRNSQLRHLVGLSDIDAGLRSSNHHIIPSPGAFTNFLGKHANHRNELDQLFNALKAIIKEKLPDFGKHAAGDGKYYDSYTPNKHSAEAKDHRGELDAAYSQKTYRFLGDDGKCMRRKRPIMVSVRRRW
ncbi:MAG: transposase [Erysipelotrichaceae bacterium]|nr:transposase [Erysipelotrichaceae bacterium]